MATPPPEIRRLYEAEPALAHPIVDVEPRVEHALEAMLAGFTSHPADRELGHCNQARRPIRE
jgi:hypothetical protein